MCARIVEPSEQNIADAAQRLRAGGVVAFPTETVYGLGAATLDETALARVYQLKGRPRDNPLIAHVVDAAKARSLTDGWDDRCDAIAERFWPGPLTIVVPRAVHVPSAAAGGRDTIAIRAPRHLVARDLLALFDGAISAPSANLSGHTSPTRAEHVAHEFADADDLMILDGGASPVGIESTVLSLTGEQPRILRPGDVTGEQIEDALSQAVQCDAPQQQAESPGTSESHYAPRIPARLVRSSNGRIDLTVDASAAARGARHIAIMTLGEVAISPTSRDQRVTLLTMPTEPRDYAHALYATMRAAEDSGAELLLIEHPCSGGRNEPTGELNAPTSATWQWTAILDRLRRATAV